MQTVLTAYLLHQFFRRICWFQLCPQDIQENLHHGVPELLASSVKFAQLHPGNSQEANITTRRNKHLIPNYNPCIVSIKPEESKNGCCPGQLLSLSISG